MDDQEGWDLRPGPSHSLVLTGPSFWGTLRKVPYKVSQPSWPQQLSSVALGGTWLCPHSLPDHPRHFSHIQLAVPTDGSPSGGVPGNHKLEAQLPGA